MLELILRIRQIFHYDLFRVLRLLFQFTDKLLSVQFSRPFDSDLFKSHIGAELKHFLLDRIDLG